MSDTTNPKDLMGAKKPDLSLVSPAGLIYEALAMGVGGAIYGPYNWRDKKIQARVYVAAAMRHLSQWLDGEDTDRDLETCEVCIAKANDASLNCRDHSWLPHLGHAKACIGILIDAKETDHLIDNRPLPGAAGRLIRRYTKK